MNIDCLLFAQIHMRLLESATVALRVRVRHQPDALLGQRIQVLRHLLHIRRHVLAIPVQITQIAKIAVLHDPDCKIAVCIHQTAHPAPGSCL